MKNRFSTETQMAVWHRRILWSFTFLLAGAVGQRVNYPGPVCAVKGSTVTLPCSFTPLRSFTDQSGRQVALQVIRVLWCQNHEICQHPTPSVYESPPQNKNNPRYEYLGDQKGNCTLQIRDVQKEDDAVLRFRVEANDFRGHFTERSGVRVTVVAETTMRINSFPAETEVRQGQTLTLSCTSDCSFHPLEVTWFRNGHALSESGPTLQLGPLTAKDSGNYTCTVKANASISSQVYSLFVEDVSRSAVVAGVVVGVLLVLTTLILVFFISRRKRAATAGDKDQRAVGDEAEQQHYDNISSSVVQSGQERWRHPQETSGAEEDVTYASIQLKENNQTRRVERADAAIIYTALASRG